MSDIELDAARMRAFRKASTGKTDELFCNYFMSELERLVNDTENPNEEQFNQAIDATMKEFP